MLYQSRGGENGQMQKTELVWAAANLRLQGRNPNAGHVSFWEGVKSEGKFSGWCRGAQLCPLLGTKETSAVGTASLLMGWPSYQLMKNIRVTESPRLNCGLTDILLMDRA